MTKMPGVNVLLFAIVVKFGVFKNANFYSVYHFLMIMIPLCVTPPALVSSTQGSKQPEKSRTYAIYTPPTTCNLQENIVSLRRIRDTFTMFTPDGQ